MIPGRDRKHRRKLVKRVEDEEIAEKATTDKDSAQMVVAPTSEAEWSAPLTYLQDLTEAQSRGIEEQGLSCLFCPTPYVCVIAFTWLLSK